MSNFIFYVGVCFFFLFCKMFSPNYRRGSQACLLALFLALFVYFSLMLLLYCWLSFFQFCLPVCLLPCLLTVFFLALFLLCSLLACLLACLLSVDISFLLAFLFASFLVLFVYFLLVFLLYCWLSFLFACMCVCFLDCVLLFGLSGSGVGSRVLRGIAFLLENKNIDGENVRTMSPAMRTFTAQTQSKQRRGTKTSNMEHVLKQFILAPKYIAL